MGSLSLPLLKYTFVDSRIGVSRTTALLMYIYCTMAPGAHSTDESSQDQRTCLSSSGAHSTDESSQDQRTCLSSSRDQGSRHHRGQDNHLHPVPHIAQADGDCWGKGHLQYLSGYLATWRPTRLAQHVERLPPSEDYCICQSIAAFT